MVAEAMAETAATKLGIFGGSFDPVHLGHTSLALDAMEQAGLEKVIFVPAKQQPFKLEKKTAPGADRLNMLQLALAGKPGLEISEYELNEDRISYTFLTMRAMRKRFGNDVKLYFITGTDAFLNIERWKEAPEMLTEYAYLIGTRPGYKTAELDACIDRVARDYNTEVRRVDNTQIDVSSTEIRSRMEAGLPAGDLLSAEVERYIREHGLYR